MLISAVTESFYSSFFLDNTILSEVSDLAEKSSESEIVQNISGIVTTNSFTSVALDIPILGISTSRTSDIPNHHILSGSTSFSSATTTTVYSTINKSKCSTKTDDTPVKIHQKPVTVQENFINIQPSPDEIINLENHIEENSGKSVDADVPCISVPLNVQETNRKRKCDNSCEAEPPSKRTNQNMLNHSLPLLNLSNNHPLKKHSKMNRNGENVKKSSPKVMILDHDIIVPSTSVSLPAQIDLPVSKPMILDRNMHTTRPSTPLSTSKNVMSIKTSVIPPEISSVSYANQKSPCYMPKTTYSPVLNVPKLATTNAW